MPDPAAAGMPQKRRRLLWKKAGGNALSLSLLIHLVLLVIAAFWVLRETYDRPDTVPDFVSAPGGGGGGNHGTSVKLQPSFRQPQAASSSFDTRRVTISGPSDLALPDQEISSLFDTPLLASGVSDAIASSGSGGGAGGGSGTGIGPGTGGGRGPGHGPGNGLGGFPPVKFFGLPAKATRVAYVIDFSKSMNGKRQRLMRDELVKSISGLDLNQQYQLVFFAGPVWFAGSKVTMAADQKSGVVTTVQGREHRFTSRSIGEWDMAGKKQSAPWLTTDEETIQSSVAAIRETPLVYGTDWKPAIELALDMSPAPEVIYFMTDGIVSAKVYEVIDGLARSARHHKCVIHTIAMMEPEAADAMSTLATKTGGSFTMIHPDGTTTKGSTSP